MSLADPTFASIDFGFSNTDANDWRAFARCFKGEIEVARSAFSFPGVDSEFEMVLGRRGQTITWIMTTVSKTTAALTALEQAIEAKLDTGTAYTMTMHGRTMTQVVLRRFAEMGPPQGFGSPWLFGKRYLLEFRNLNP